MSVSPVLARRSSLALFASLSLSLLAGSLQAQAPVITATKSDGVPAATKVLPGATVTYTNTIANSGAAAATGVTFTDPDVANTTMVPGSVHISPLAINDSYQTLANTTLNVAEPGGPSVQISFATTLRANDVTLNAPGGTDTTTIVSHTAPANGTIGSFDNSDGSFAYIPNAGFVGTDTFTYTVQNNADVTLTDTATVTITVLDSNPVVAGNQKIWYVQNNAAAGGLGRSQDPFDTLVEAQTASAAGDTIYVFQGSGTTGQTAGIVLKDSQRLLGEGVALTVPVAVNGGSNPTALRSSGTAPSISNTAGAAVAALNLSSIEIRGFNISTTGAGNNAVDIQTTGANNGSAEVANNTITAAGANGIDFNGNSTGTLNASVHDNTVTATTNGIEIQRVAGAVYITAFDDNVVSGDTGAIGIYVNTATFDATPGGAYQQVSGGLTAVGTSVNTVGASAMELSNVSGDLAFTDLDLYAVGTGLGLDGTGVVNVAAGTGTRLLVLSAVATFVSTSNAAVFALDATIDIQSALITSSNSIRQGLYLAAIGAGSTSSIFSANSASSITSASLADIDVSASNASISYNGTITDDLGTLVAVANNTGGIVSFNGAITDGNDGDGSGISLTSNTGATINFSGGLTLSTGANPAFTATGGGTINVIGSANTIATTTATALNVTSTTIGASHLTFRSISSNGGSATGIILDTTGSTGGLHVVGTGATASGGTIASKTGADGAFTTGNGIYLNNTIDVRLAWMQLNDFQNSAVRGFGVTGFSLTNSVISGTIGTSTSEIEGAIAFGHVGPTYQNGLIGSSLIDNVNISGSVEHHLEFYNQSGTMNLTITNSNIHDNSVAGGSDGIQMEFRGTAQVFTHIRGNSFSNNKSQAIQISALETSNVHTTISGNTITRGTQGNEGIVLSNGGDADLTTLIGGPTVADGNTITGFGGVAIFVGQVPNQGTAASLLQATIQRNTVTSPLSATNHAVIAFASSLTGQVSQSRFLIDNNTVNYASDAARAILVDTPDPSRTPEFHATVTNNVVNSTNAGALTMISVAARNGAVGHSDVRSNDVNMVAAGVQLNVRESALGSNVLARGGSASNDSGVVLAANNPLSTTAVQPTVGDVPVVENNTITQASAPTLPGLPLLFAPAEIESFSAAEPDSVQSAIAWTETVRNSMLRNQSPAISSLPMPAISVARAAQNAPASTLSQPHTALTQSELDTVVAAARAHWAATGLSAEQKTLLNNLSFEVTDLPGWYLGENANGLIRVDADAGGNGWFIDTTPSDNSEFSGSGPSTINSQLSTPASGRIDLLTTVLHEMGHSLGLCDTYSKLQRHSVMYGFLTKGERRLPAQGQAAGAVPHEHTTPHHLGAPLSIGTLPAGKSVTIKYGVVVNDPPLAGTLTSQATVSGSNFSNVLTDDLVTGGDPLLPGTADPTVTLVDLPDVSVTIGAATSQLENSGLPLTYTFTRTGATTSALAVNFSITGTATVSSSDFSVFVPVGSTFDGPSSTGTALIGIGLSSVSITITPTADTTVEPDETAIVNVVSSSIYDVGVPASAIGTITNDDADIAVTVAPASVAENSGSALTYTFTRTGYTGVAATANFAVSGTATRGGSAPANDFTSAGFSGATGSVAFAIGDTTKTLTVTPVGDVIDEDNETVVLTMTSGTNYNVAGSPATGTIIDDDLAPTVSIPTPSAFTEGNSGTSNFSFFVNLNETSAKTVTVNYATANGTATAGSDYVATSGTLTFTPGVTTMVVSVPVNGDTLNEPNETLTVTISAPTNATLSTSVATGTINNDDPVPTLAISDVTLPEGNAGTTAFTFTVTLSTLSGQTVTVNYGTADGTALAGSDYAAASGTLTFSPTETVKTVTVLVNGDTTSESSEAFVVNLSGPTNATIADGQGLGTITDDDLPQVSVATVALGDNDAAEGGSNNGLYTFTRNSTLGALTVNFQLDVSSTAVAGTDFTLTGANTTFDNATGTGTIAFANGVGSVTLTLSALTESPNPAEAAEIARLNVVASPGVYVVGASPNATVTIAENSFLVTTTADDGTGSLRQAILNANTIAGANTITFAGATFTDGTPDTITVVSSPLFLTSEITIEGPTAAPLSLSGGGTQLVMVSTAGDAVPLLVKDLIITNGFQSVNISGGLVNTTTAAATTTFLRCQFVNNIGSGAGAITNISGTLNLVNCVVANNTATAATGGACGAIANGAPLNLINTTVSGNSAPNASAAPTQVAGGIASGAGAVTITNSTITNNSVGTAGNTSGLAQFGGTVTVSNSIIAGNVSNTTNPDLTGAFTSNGGNVIGNRGTATGFTQGVINDQVGTAGTPVNPLLGPLANNGGTTLTHALLTGSPALNNGFTANVPLDTFDADGDSNTAETLDVDQRGATFIRSIGNPDSGAFELQKSVSIIADATSKNEGASGTNNFTFTVSRTGGTVGAVAMTYTVGGAAVNGTDFVGGTLPTGTATIADGSASTVVTIPVSGDTTRENNEAFTVTLSAPNNGYVVSGVPATSTITNDDFEADLAITATDGVTTAIPGGSVTYTITVSNAGPDPVVGATVADTFPASLTANWTAVGAGGGTVASPGPNAGNINTTVNLPSGGSVTFTATATINASATGTLTNTATIATAGGVTDTNPANNSATDTDTLTPQANLAITVTDGVTTATPGGTVTYTITASNAGPSNAPGATVADTFPAALTTTWVGVGAGGGTATASGSGNINDTVNLPVGGSVTYTVTATINPAATGTLSNTATVTAPGGVTDPTPANNSATDTDTLTPSADLAVTVTDSPDPVVAGTNLTYTITASNSGPSTAATVALSDTLPAGTTFVSLSSPGGWSATTPAVGSTGTISASISSLAPAASGVFTLTVNVGSGVASASVLSNTATITSATTDPNPGNNAGTASTTVTAQADLAITVTDGVTTATPGGTVTYTITASNAGPSNATGANVSDTFPASLTANWTSVGAGGGTATPAGAGNINDSVNLPVGGSVTYTVTATIATTASGTLSNTATVTAPGGVTDPTPGNNSATDTDTLGNVVSIAATDANADENTAGTGTWRVTRNGTVGAITVQLQIHASTTAVVADWSQSGASFASLAAGSTGTIVIPDGVGFADITLTPSADIHAEADETVLLTVAPDASYTAINPSSAAITIGANDFVVINANDAGEGSLRQAVTNGNFFSTDDTITFATPQTVVLTTGELVVQTNGTLFIQGTTGTSISGDNNSRVFNINSGASLMLRGLWIKDGHAASDGGAILNAGSLAVISSTLSGNVADAPAAAGGAIFNNAGSVAVVNSTISGNTTTASGGAIHNSTGVVSVVNSTISGNGGGANGGGIHNDNGTLIIDSSTVTANSTTNGGGGGVFGNGGDLSLYNSIIAGNTATTGSTDLYNSGTTTANNNLVGVDTGHSLVNGTNGNLVGTTATPLNPLIGALANNGGPTLTHALQDGSPAINAGDTGNLPADTFDVDGNSNTAEALPVDQRGATFARVIGSIVDIGAYEAFAFRPAITASTTNEDTQSTTGLVITPNTADGGLTTAFKITSIVGGTLFKADGTTAITAGTFLTLPEGAAGLKFTPSLNLNSPATTFGFDAQATVDGADSGLRTGVATAIVTVTPVNDAPTVVAPGIADQTLLVTETRSVALSPAFTDVDLDTLTFTVQTNSDSAKATAVINGTNVDIQGLAPGITDITILANDGNTGTVTDTFRILVGTPNPTPGPVPPPPGPGGYTVTAQTGLFTINIPVTNTTAGPINGFRLFIDYSAYLAAYPSLRLYNSTSAPGVSPAFIDFPFPMAINDVVNVQLNFYTSTRTFPNPFAPVLTVTSLAASDVPGPAGPGVEATIRVPTPGRVILEWATTPGLWYRVQYTDNLAVPNSWFYSPIPLQASGTRMQWIDTGAPFTSSPPAGSRFYRVNQIPAPTP